MPISVFFRAVLIRTTKILNDSSTVPRHKNNIALIGYGPQSYLAIKEGSHRDKLGNATVSARAINVSHRYGKLALYIRPTETSSPTTLFK
jgi:hypothetical protein